MLSLVADIFVQRVIKTLSELIPRELSACYHLSGSSCSKSYVIMAVFRSSFSGVVGVLSSLGDIFVQRVSIIEIWGLFSGAVGVLSLSGVHFYSKNYVVAELCRSSFSGALGVLFQKVMWLWSSFSGAEMTSETD